MKTNLNRAKNFLALARQTTTVLRAEKNRVTSEALKKLDLRENAKYTCKKSCRTCKKLELQHNPKYAAERLAIEIASRNLADHLAIANNALSNVVDPTTAKFVRRHM